MTSAEEQLLHLDNTTTFIMCASVIVCVITCPDWTSCEVPGLS